MLYDLRINVPVGLTFFIYLFCVQLPVDFSDEIHCSVAHLPVKAYIFHSFSRTSRSLTVYRAGYFAAKYISWLGVKHQSTLTLTHTHCT